MVRACLRMKPTQRTVGVKDSRWGWAKSSAALGRIRPCMRDFSVTQARKPFSCVSQFEIVPIKQNPKGQKFLCEEWKMMILLLKTFKVLLTHCLQMAE